MTGRVAREKAAMRRLYCRDSYGHVHRDRQAEQKISGGSGIPARFIVTTLLVLAAIVVLASLIRLPARPRDAARAAGSGPGSTSGQQASAPTPGQSPAPQSGWCGPELSLLILVGAAVRSSGTGWAAVMAGPDPA